MRKRYTYFYYIILFLFLQVLGCFLGITAFAEGEETASVMTPEQKSVVVDHCDAIKDNLKTLQRTDSRTRVYLGRYYETILVNFITPLNIRLVENNISNNKLIDNQTNFVSRRNSFVNDYVAYQQALEELVNTDCKNEPEKFYERLQLAREKRKVVNKDVINLRALTDEQQKLVEELKNGLK